MSIVPFTCCRKCPTEVYLSTLICCLMVMQRVPYKCVQCRLPATIRCLSHLSAHVRTLSTSVLRDILYTDTINSKQKMRDRNGIHGPYQFFNPDAVNWKADIEKCLTWEAHSRLLSGMSLQFLSSAAKELGCTVVV